MNQSIELVSGVITHSTLVRSLLYSAGITLGIGVIVSLVAATLAAWLYPTVKRWSNDKISLTVYANTLGMVFFCAFMMFVLNYPTFRGTCDIVVQTEDKPYTIKVPVEYKASSSDVCPRDGALVARGNVIQPISNP